VKHLIFALKAADANAAVPTLVSLLKSGKVKQAQQVDLLELLASAGGPNELSLVFERALTDESARPKLLAALEEASRKRNVKAAGDLTRLRPLLAAKHDDLTKP